MQPGVSTDELCGRESVTRGEASSYFRRLSFRAAVFLRSPPRVAVHTLTKGEEVAPMQTTLDALPVGASAVVTALCSTGAQRRRMLDLGFVPGAGVRALHASPWGDPVAYGVRSAVIALRREDAGSVQIEML